MIRVGKVQSQSPTARFGTTLSEVLISLLIMSIGVVSLATLFPISVLRTVQATQLTNATNLRYNVEALLDVQPQFFTVGQSWKPGVSYAVGTLVIPTPVTSLKSPAVVFQCTTAGTSGTFEPNWNFNSLTVTNDGPALQWTAFLLQNYVVDPLGQVLVEPGYRLVAATGMDYFGNTALNSPWQGIAGTNWGGILAFSGFSSTPTDAAAGDVATLPDSWINQVESTDITAHTDHSCTLGNMEGTLSIPTSTDAYPPSRIVLFDITGKISHVRPIYHVTGTQPNLTFDWAPPFGVATSGPLPLNFVPVRARVETHERRYTWLLSVRRGFSGTAYMDVVVFFRRPFSGKDEQVYPATFTATTDFGADKAPGVSGIDDDGNGIKDWSNPPTNTIPDPAEIGFPGSDDTARNWVMVQYNATGDRPFVKKGGFVTDVDNLRWYRIIDVEDSTTAALALNAGGITNPAGLNPYPFASAYQVDGSAFGANTKFLFLRVETPIAASGSQPAAAGGVPTGHAMLMRGIVDVYPIRTQMAWGH